MLLRLCQSSRTTASNQDVDIKTAECVGPTNSEGCRVAPNDATFYAYLVRQQTDPAVLFASLACETASMLSHKQNICHAP